LKEIDRSEDSAPRNWWPQHCGLEHIERDAKQGSCHREQAQPQNVANAVRDQQKDVSGVNEIIWSEEGHVLTGHQMCSRIPNLLSKRFMTCKAQTIEHGVGDKAALSLNYVLIPKRMVELDMEPACPDVESNALQVCDLPSFLDREHLVPFQTDRPSSDQEITTETIMSPQHFRHDNRVRVICWRGTQVASISCTETNKRALGPIDERRETPL
jgi:hypothetical protein